MNLFGRKNEGRVPLGPDVIMNCRCIECPVQGLSACSDSKVTKLIGGRDLPSPDEFPGPYCAIGKADCDDLDLSQACICNTCRVYKNYDLASGRPIEHFCFNDKALKH